MMDDKLFKLLCVIFGSVVGTFLLMVLLLVVNLSRV